jgi:preprotein translocase subunit YajC
VIQTVSRCWALIAQAEQTPGLPGSTMMTLAVIMCLFYLLMMRPQRKKDREFREMVENLKEKDRVVTIGGIHGVVTNVQRDAGTITLRVDESTGTKIRVGTSAVSKVVVEDQSGDAPKT